VPRGAVGTPGLELMQTEYLCPAAGDRKGDDERAERIARRDGARDEKVEEILASHFPDHIPEAVDAAIRERFPVRRARACGQPPARSRRRGRAWRGREPRTSTTGHATAPTMFTATGTFGWHFQVTPAS